MSDIAVSSTAPQFQALVATKIKQPDAAGQAAAVKAVDGAGDKVAATLASIASGVDIQA
jgi:hypothetical protein